MNEIFICAIDSDILSLEGTHYNWNKKEWVTTTKEEAVYKFWCNMITGTHNNTKGIPKKGIKYAEKVLILSEEEMLAPSVTYNQFCRNTVFREYINHFGEYKGIQEFYKNYMCLYILEEKEGFILPEAIEFKNDSVGEEESIQNEA